jgi:predicted dehydrogenase
MRRLNIGIIGAGYIAKEHLKVLKSINDFVISGIVSRTKKKSKKLAREFGIKKVFNSIEEMMKSGQLDGVLILVSADSSFKVTKKIIPYKVPFFLEKPPGLSLYETEKLYYLTRKHITKNMIGLNRRFYSVFSQGMQIIKKHGKLLGILVEGHERFWLLKKKFKNLILKKWIFVNSLHTIDLLLFFGGKVKSISKFKKSYKEKKGDQFCSIIEFKNGALGTYVSNWHSPGGWSVKLFGERVTVEFNPLEVALWIDSKFKRRKIVPSKHDQKFKPGFYKQMLAFKKLVINGQLEWPAQSLKEVIDSVRLVKKISS